MSFSQDKDKILKNTPFTFNYTLTVQDYSQTLKKYSQGKFYVCLNGYQLKLGNGTNVQTEYEKIDVTPVNNTLLSFPNRSYNIPGTYNFILKFNIGPPYYQDDPKALFQTTITILSELPRPPPPISNTCFPVGTPVTTNQGIIPIEKIDPNIHTIRNNKIVHITKTIIKDKYVICFEKDSIKKNIPSQKTIISKNHKILYNGDMIKAKDFIGKFDNIYKIKYTDEILYNVLMEKHDTMIVNNLICETLHPESLIAILYEKIKNLTPEEKEQTINEYNDYCIKNNIFTSKKITK